MEDISRSTFQGTAAAADAADATAQGQGVSGTLNDTRARFVSRFLPRRRLFKFSRQ